MNDLASEQPAWVIGIDLGASKIALGLVDPQNRVIGRRRLPTLAPAGPQAAVARMAAAVAELRQAAPDQRCVAGIGICSPGPLDHRSGVLIDPPNLTGWRDIPLRQMLAEATGLPVQLEHDAKAAALGEYHYGAGRGAADMVYIVVGTGVGAAVIVGGELYRGPHNSAGEVGHITIDPAGDRCACGNVGCVETFTSGPALAGRYARALASRGAPQAERPEIINGELVTQAAAMGDPLALGVLAEAGEALGTAIASLAMLMDVDLYVIGSSVARCGDLLLEPARAAVPRHCFRSVASRVRIVCSELGDDGPILGCAWLARQLV
jgi:glucokinase